MSLKRGLLRGALCSFALCWCGSARASRHFMAHDEAQATDFERPSAETPRARVGPGFVYLPAATPLVACGLRAMANQALTKQVTDAERVLGLDVQLAIVLATTPIGCDSLFYVPVENDISGIGYANTNGADVFDEDLESGLEGIAFLNDWPYWEQEFEEFRTAFLHEIGHRWGARVDARRDGVTYRLTGREGGHWSYFLDSGGSPLEGNRFDPEPPLRTATPPLRLDYSPLDLYLMGVLEPDAVGPIRLLHPGAAEGLDCAGYNVSAASPPQTCKTNVLSGDWVELQIEDVINSEGLRLPPATHAASELSIGVFVMGSQPEAWTLASCERLTAGIDQALLDFARATGDRMRLQNQVSVELSCADLLRSDRDEVEIRSEDAGCTIQTVGPFTRLSLVAHLLGLGLLFSARKLRTQASGQTRLTV